MVTSVRGRAVRVALTKKAVIRIQDGAVVVCPALLGIGVIRVCESKYFSKVM